MDRAQTATPEETTVGETKHERRRRQRIWSTQSRSAAGKTTRGRLSEHLPQTTGQPHPSPPEETTAAKRNQLITKKGKKNKKLLRKERETATEEKEKEEGMVFLLSVFC